MKIKNIAIALSASLTLGSCVKDLDTKPLNDYDFTVDVAYSSAQSYAQGLGKIYGGFVLVGPNEGSSNIDVADPGTSELNRAFWSLQEIPTDAVKCAWQDSWVSDVNKNQWTTAENTVIQAAYTRIIVLATEASEYLRQTTDEKLNERGTSEDLYKKIQEYRAEAKFLRAYAYWMGLDLFGNLPFVDENSPIGTTELPPYYTSVQLFEFIEKELLALTEDAGFKSQGARTYPQVDKAAAWALLARLYINAQVYIGQDHSADAKTAAAAVINGGAYDLAPNFEELFMGDNSENTSVHKELIFATAYDGVHTKSWGGTSFLLAATTGANDETAKEIMGATDSWGGLHTDDAYLTEFFGVTNVDSKEGTFNVANNDIRGQQFAIKNRDERNILDPLIHAQGWVTTKFKNTNTAGGTSNAGVFSSTDFTNIRFAEVLLVYAEANLRSGGSSSDAVALDCLNRVRKRAGINTPMSSYTLNDIFQERSRELFFEAHRRTDLRRFDYYSSADYLWKWKGGVANGTAISSHLELFPLVAEDVNVNTNLVQNPGY